MSDNFAADGTATIRDRAYYFASCDENKLFAWLMGELLFKLFVRELAPLRVGFSVALI